MRREVTTLLGLVIGLMLTGTALAQTDVSVADINAIPQDSVDALNAEGAALDPNNVPMRIFNDLNGQSVRFVGVVLNDPLNSGLSSPGNDGLPSRIHVFVRDTSASSLGNRGLGVQLVDGAWETSGLDAVVIGDVIEVIGNIGPFFNTMQVAPTTITPLGSYLDFGLSPTILDPIVITTDELNKSVGTAGEVQVNWSNLADLRGNFVRFENATVVRRDISTDRPNWIFTTDDGTTIANNYDTSLRVRNDRSAYSDTFNKRTSADGDFEPPPSGSKVNVQGFVVFNNDDPFNRSLPPGHILSVNIWEDSDLEVTETPPLITNIIGPAPGADPVQVSADIQADPTRSLTTTALRYVSSSAPDTLTVAADGPPVGDTYTFTIPTPNDGDFVTYFVQATDNTGALSETAGTTFRVLSSGIDSIDDIQITQGEVEGASPFNDITLAMDITATVQNKPDSSGWLAVSDDPALGPWSGIVVEITPDVQALNLQPGDVINITAGTIDEIRGIRFDRSGDVTGIGAPTVSVVSTGGAPHGYKVVTTDVLQNPGVAEAHESMMLRFENPFISNILPDAPSDFGEFSVSSDDTQANEVRVDDESPAVPFETNDGFTGDEQLAFVQGVWTHTFGNFKLFPEDPTDIGMVTNVATEGEEVPNEFALDQNFPNPFNPATTIRYDVARSGHVTLAVYDVLGRQVAMLLDAESPAGTFEVRFDASNLSSGMYLYRLSAKDQVINKTMVLLK